MSRTLPEASRVSSERAAATNAMLAIGDDDPPTPRAGGALRPPPPRGAGPRPARPAPRSLLPGLKQLLDPGEGRPAVGPQAVDAVGADHLGLLAAGCLVIDVHVLPGDEGRSRSDIEVARIQVDRSVGRGH